MGKPSEYSPDVVSPPGETLQDVLDERGMTQKELSDRTGHATKVINEIIKGKAPITARTALELERVLGVSARFWLNRESKYQEHLARVDEQARLTKLVAWVKRFPYAQMAKLGWVEDTRDNTQRAHNLLQFFGVTTPGRWNTMYAECVRCRKSRAIALDREALASWLRRGRLEGNDTRCEPFNKDKFKEALAEVRSLTLEPAKVFRPRVTELCAAYGVAVVFVPELPKIRTWGATCWLTSEKALLQLSLFGKYNDLLWFTFFHEAGHILLHGKRDVFLETDQKDEDDAELQADRFAADTLISKPDYASLLSDSPFTKQKVRQFAQEIGIAPGIVVGRLQHDRQLPMSHFNDLKRRFRWAV